jgi:hypothetical protein
MRKPATSDECLKTRQLNKFFKSSDQLPASSLDSSALNSNDLKSLDGKTVHTRDSDTSK